jgi:hypothetical protein
LIVELRIIVTMVQRMKISKITKVAGVSLLGFCAVSLAADRLPLNPLASQVAGFAGAFLGLLVAKTRSKTNRRAASAEAAKR